MQRREKEVAVTMLFLPYTSPKLASSSDCSVSAAIKCVLSYTYGLDDCCILVEVMDGNVVLFGHASDASAVATAICVAREFTAKPILSKIEITSFVPPLPATSPEYSANDNTPA
jgi:hypothetical protein